MTNIFHHKLTMYRTVASVIEDHKNSWKGLSAFGLIKTVFIDKIDLLEEQLSFNGSNTDKQTSLLVSQIDVLLKDQMDLLVGILRPTDATFHKDYFNARVVANINTQGNSSDENLSGSAA